MTLINRFAVAAVAAAVLVPWLAATPAVAQVPRNQAGEAVSHMDRMHDPREVAAAAPQPDTAHAARVEEEMQP